MAVRDLARRWSLATRALRKDDQKYGEELVRMIQQHSSAGFCAFDDPLESAMFSVLVELAKQRDCEHVDP
jgi:hypothetical protein